jgi:ribosomal protein S18 acetylase RimI-like enzyme
MSWKAEFCKNRATEEQIAEHLVLCDARFVPPLSSRVEIKQYAHKIYAHGLRFEAWAEGSLIGLVAMYCNRLHQRLAYITNVSVLGASPPGAHIASQLLERGIGYLREYQFECVDLEVNKDNNKAIRLYERHGFVANATNGHTLSMRLELERKPE